MGARWAIDEEYALKSHTLTCEFWLPLEIEQAFSFFSDVANLAKITPPWLNFTVTSPMPVVLMPGCTIDYTIRWLFIKMNWQTLITDYDPPNWFRDTQSRGPYRFWRHTHRLRSADGGTSISDHVEYALPFGLAGELAHRVRVKAQLFDIFSFRQAKVAQLLLGQRAAEAREIKPIRID